MPFPKICFILAAIVFALAVFGVSLGTVNLVALGLFLVALGWAL